SAPYPGSSTPGRKIRSRRCSSRRPPGAHRGSPEYPERHLRASGIPSWAVDHSPSDRDDSSETDDNDQFALVTATDEIRRRYSAMSTLVMVESLSRCRPSADLVEPRNGLLSR